MTARPLKVVPTFASVAAGFAEPGEFNLNPIAMDPNTAQPMLVGDNASALILRSGQKSCARHIRP